MDSTDTEYTACLETLSIWVKKKKEELYDLNIKSPKNTEKVLEEFTQACEKVGNGLLKDLNSENQKNLQEIGWPSELMECIKRSDIRTVLCNEIENWFIRFPFVKSKLHLEELERENAGIR